MKTVAVLYCDQPVMLAHQVGAWRQWPRAALEGLEFIVVDDCSQQPAVALLRRLGAHVRVIRVTRSAPWNIGACRNLAFDRAHGDAVIALDCDQVLSPSQAEYLAAMDVRPHCYYPPHLVDGITGAEHGTHRHVQLCRRIDFLATGGYDGAWTGYESDHLFAPRRDAAMFCYDDPDFAVTHFHAPCMRWPRTGRENARQRDTRAFTRAMRDYRPPPKLHVYPWQEVVT